MRIVECLLMLKEGVVHLPKLPLSGGSFRGLRGMLSMRVTLVQGEVPKDKTQPITQTLLNLLDDRVSRPTIRTLVITIFHQCHRGGFWSLPMISLTYWQCQPGRFCFLCHCFLSLSIVCT